MKILITNTVTLNAGDAAIIIAIIHVLRKTFGSNTEFVVYDSQPDIVSRYYPELNFRKSIYFSINDLSNRFIRKCIRHFKFLNYIWSQLNCLRFYFAAWCWCNNLRRVATILLNKCELEDLISYESADIIISTGGTYLVENYSLSPRIFDYKISLLMGKPLVFFTQSLGPFSNEHNRAALSKIFSNALLILLRDEKSREHLMDLDVDMQKVHIFPDIAFALPEEGIPKKRNARICHHKQALNIGISVRHWPYFKHIDNTTGMERYMEAVSKVIAHLQKKYNAKMTFISSSQGIPEYWADDSKVAMEIWNGLSDNIKKYVRVDHRFHTPFELLEILRSFDVVIATRMHMIILSLMSGTPVIPIANEFKTKELCKRLGLDQWVLDIETIDGENFQESIESLLAHFPEISEMVLDRVAKERQLSMDSGKRVKEAYDHWLKLQNR